MADRAAAGANLLDGLAQVAVVWAQDRLSIEWVSAEKLRPVREAPDGGGARR